MIEELGILAITAAGLGCGYALTKIAPEEMKDGKKYFILMQRVLGSIVAALIAYAAFDNIYLAAIIAIPAFFIHLIPSWAAFSIFSVSAFFLGHALAPFIFSSLFLYGFPIGSLEKKFWLPAIPFLVLGFTISLF